MSELAVPTTLEEATAFAARFAELDGGKAKIEARRQARLAKINGEADAEIAAIAANLDKLAAALKPWWAANAAALTEGKRKSIELAGCQIGTKLSRFAVTFAAGDDEAAVAALKNSRWRPAADLLRVKTYLDRTAIGKALGGSMAKRLKALGFDLTPGTDEFFVDRLGAAPIGRDSRSRA